MKPELLFFFTSLLYSQDSFDRYPPEPSQSESSHNTPKASFVQPRTANSTLTNFVLAAQPSRLVLVAGGTGTMVISQTNPAFTGTVSYSVLNLPGVPTHISMLGNTATITFSAPLDAGLGTQFGIVEANANGTTKQLSISVVINDKPKITSPNLAGSISVSSVPGSGQSIDFTALGTADWFTVGSAGPGSDPCLDGGRPCAATRKIGGSGLVAAVNGGTRDSSFYSFSPNLVNVSWTDGTFPPNGTAAHVNNTFLQLQAFAGVSARVMTLVAGIAGGGTLKTNFHMTDGTTADVNDVSSFDNYGVRVFTITFNASSLGHQLVVTLSHTGGELLLYGAALAGTLAPQEHNLQLTDNIAAFLGGVTAGDSLVLPNGYSFVGHLILPVRRDTGWVEIKSNTTISPGRRVLPGDLKAALTSPDELPVIQNDMYNSNHAKRPTHGWKFTGIEITANNQKAQLNYGLIAFGFGDAPVAGDISRDVMFERCYIHGDGTSNYIRGITGNANNISVIDSYLAGFVSTFMEANAINIFSSAGPIQIINNYLEATAENIMIGGTGPDVASVLVPTRGLIQHNYIKKLPSWRGSDFKVKNLLEFKNGYNFLVDSNVFENCWEANQGGAAILLTPRTNNNMGTGYMLTNHVDTITFTNNIIRHAGSGMVVGSYDDLARDPSGQPVPPSQLLWVHDVTLRNNLFDDLSLTYANTAHGLLIFGPPNNLVLDHNTFNFSEQTNDHGWYLANDTGVAPSNASVTGNEFGADLYGDSRGPGNAMLTGAVFVSNNIRNGSSAWKATPIGDRNTLNAVAPPGVGSDVAGLLVREVSVKGGNR